MKESVMFTATGTTRREFGRALTSNHLAARNTGRHQNPHTAIASSAMFKELQRTLSRMGPAQVVAFMPAISMLLQPMILDSDFDAMLDLVDSFIIAFSTETNTKMSIRNTGWNQLKNIIPKTVELNKTQIPLRTYIHAVYKYYLSRQNHQQAMSTMQFQQSFGGTHDQTMTFNKETANTFSSAQKSGLEAKLTLSQWFILGLEFVSQYRILKNKKQINLTDKQMYQFRYKTLGPALEQAKDKLASSEAGSRLFAHIQTAELKEETEKYEQQVNSLTEQLAALRQANDANADALKHAEQEKKELHSQIETFAHSKMTIGKLKSRLEELELENARLKEQQVEHTLLATRLNAVETARSEYAASCAGDSHSVFSDTRSTFSSISRAHSMVAPRSRASLFNQKSAKKGKIDSTTWGVQEDFDHCYKVLGSSYAHTMKRVQLFLIGRLKLDNFTIRNTQQEFGCQANDVEQKIDAASRRFAIIKAASRVRDDQSSASYSSASSSGTDNPAQVFMQLISRYEHESIPTPAFIAAIKKLHDNIQVMTVKTKDSPYQALSEQIECFMWSITTAAQRNLIQGIHHVEDTMEKATIQIDASSHVDKNYSFPGSSDIFKQAGNWFTAKQKVKSGAEKHIISALDSHFQLPDNAESCDKLIQRLDLLRQKTTPSYRMRDPKFNMKKTRLISPITGTQFVRYKTFMKCYAEAMKCYKTHVEQHKAQIQSKMQCGSYFNPVLTSS